MTTYLGKSCSFGFPRVPFVNCRQFMYWDVSLLVLRAGCGIGLYQFLIIACLFTLGISVLSVVPGRTGRDDAREATFVLYLPGKPWLCVIWPVVASTAPPDGLQVFYRHKIVGRAYLYENTAPVRVQTSSKHRAGLHSIPYDYPRGPELPGIFIWPMHKTSNAEVTWNLRVVSGS